MKSKISTLIALFLSVVGLASLTGLTSTQQPARQLKAGYYIVVAAYRQGQEDYAQKYMSKINQNGNHSEYGLDAKRKLIYVYLDYYEDFKVSISQMLKVRAAGVFNDAWVRVMKDGLDEKVNLLTSNSAAEKPKEVTETKPQQAEPKKEAVTAGNGQSEPTEMVSSNGGKSEAPVKEEVIKEEVIDNPKPDPVIPPQVLSNTPVFLSLYHGRNNQVVEGEVEVIDTDRSRLISSVKGNDYITLPDPKSNSGDLTLVCKAFGYRPVEHKINYKRTESDTLNEYIDLVGNYYMVKFNLVRIHKGDIVTLYNVYFYNDAAIMLPESQYQLNSLLQLMEENPNYKIRLHGHTNGNSKGRIIRVGPSNNFFALTDDVKDGYGSAKQLSEARAEVIKSWLVSEGVNGERIEIRAWGGKRMIHDKHSANAKKNVRVDVEVLEE